jgi:hypothetical protein
MLLEAGADWIASEPNFLTGNERDRLDVPVLNLVWSPADNVELDFQWVGRVIAFSDPDFGQTSDWGDITLRAKARLQAEAPGRPALALRFGVTLPETESEEGLGPNTLRMVAQMLMTKSLGRFTLHLNAGMAIHDKVERPAEQRDFFAWGLALERSLGERFALVADAAGRAGASSPGAEKKAEARLGLSHQRGRLALDVALRHGLTRSAGRLGVTAGIRWIAKPGHAAPAAPVAPPP